jgi:parallel beta-helix repeat protein
MLFRFWPDRKPSRTATPSRPRRLRPCVELLERRELLSTFTVSNTNDAGDNSLRWAITSANANPGPDRIEFNIGGGGVKTIALNTALPAITDPVTIDGYTQTGATKNTLPTGQGTNANLTVEVTPATANALAVGLSVSSTATTSASGTVLTGLALYGFSGAAVDIAPGSGGQAVTGVQVAGNFIGTDALSNPGGNGDGVRIQNSTGDTVGGPNITDRNLISANAGVGVHLRAGANSNFIQNNLIGTDKSGTGKSANGAQGVFIEGGASNTVGGATADLRNVISGNNGHGVDVFNGDNNVVRGNYIGTQVSGNLADGNAGNGVVVNAAKHTVVRDNVVAANVTGGVFIGDSNTPGAAAGTVVAGNYIGLGADGTTNLGNRNYGGNLSARASGTTVGGTTGPDRNVISGNAGTGVFVSGGTNATIQGNSIGTNAAGTAPVANTGDGVRINRAGVTVGGSVSGAGNVISGNGGAGIHTSTTGVVIQGNYVGVSADGATAIGNQRGVFVDSPSGASPITIGGAGDPARNVISGNSLYGIDLANVAAGAVVRNNYVGTNAGGTVAVGNQSVGVQINGGAGIQVLENVISGNGAGLNSDNATGTLVTGNFIGLNFLGGQAVPNNLYGVRVGSGSGTVIGGTTAAARNVISGNTGAGVLADGGSSTIQGNFIGTNDAGNAPVPNAVGVSISLIGINSEVAVGGTATGAGNVISGNTNQGVSVNRVTHTGVTIQGNLIGTNAAGSAALGPTNQKVGVFLDRSAGVEVGGTTAAAGNVISGNTQTGVSIVQAGNNVVAANLIGTDRLGATAVPNNSSAMTGGGGIVTDTTKFLGIKGNTISGNKGDGVLLQSGTGIILQGNHIGLNFNGTAPLANTGNGIETTQSGQNPFSDVTIGGTVAGAANVISGNDGHGILLANVSGVTIQGNFIGTDYDPGAAPNTGLIRMPNGGDGIQVGAGNSNVTIGGTAAAARNVISGNNANGVNLAGSPATVLGNYVGVGGNGSTAVFNALAGIRVSSSGNTIGMTAAGAGNVVSGNTGVGVDVVAGGSDNIAGNRVGLDGGAGNTAVANSVGIALGGTGGNALAGNVVSGNTTDGILITSATNTLGAGLVGLNAAGTAAVGNRSHGIHVLGATGNTLGLLGTGNNPPRLGMTISGNGGAGILLENASETQVVGNNIGTDAAATQAIGNALGGVVVNNGADNTIGAFGSGNRTTPTNLIAGNTNAPGITVMGNASGTVVKFSFIGSPKGLKIPNQTGVVIQDAASKTRLEGTNAGLSISGNTGDGVDVVGSPTGTFINGLIGADGSGDNFNLAADGNGGEGVLLTGGSNTTIQGTVNANGLNGIEVQGAGPSLTTITANVGNFGRTAQGNTKAGVLVANNAGGVFIGRSLGSVISGNGDAGVLLDHASNVTLVGNVIGLDPNGENAMPNGGPGVKLLGTTNVTIGGTNVGTNLLNGNLIGGNKGAGILVDQGSTGTLIQGNFIGVQNPAAITPLARPNVGDGITVTGGSTGTTIGGTAAAVGNTIVGNTAAGVRVDSGTSNTPLQGNSIGLITNTAKVTTAVPNGTDGVQVFAKVTVGGTATGAGNVISGNTLNGVLISGAGANGNLIQGNYIGTNSGATKQFGNGADGVRVTGANNVTVGAASGGVSNVISGNTLFGVQISNSTGDLIANNAIGTDGSFGAAMPNQVGVEVDNSSKVTVGGGSGTGANVISGNAQDGVLLANTDQVVIQGNLIGVKGDTAGALGNGGDGINITGTSTNTNVGGAGLGNVISGNVKNGIEFASQATGLNVLGNVIGLNQARTLKVPNNLGVRLFGAQATVGGTKGELGNVIAGNTTVGIEVNGSTTVQTIVGNFIGTNESDASGLGNGSDGVLVFAATGVVVGGTGDGQANVISGNGGSGVHVQQSNNTAVQGNRIGTNRAGTAKLANSGSGVLIDGSSTSTVASNLISGNGGNGVNLISASNGNVIQGNKIGTKADGSSTLGNTGFGVFVQGASQKNTIGNALGGSGNGNVIAFNAKGVVVGSNLTDNSVQNAVLGNSIFDNTVLGIDLGNNGVTPNDMQDPDIGPNLLQNFPTLTGAQMDGTNVRVTGTLNSIPKQTFRVEFFASDSGAPSGFGQGKTFLGFQDVATDASGNGTIDVTLTGVTAGQVITATATDANGNTSEFSGWIPATQPVLRSLPPASPPAPDGTASPTSPSGPGPQLVAVAFQKNGVARVRVQDAATGRVLALWTPFPGHRGKLRLQRRDVNGDGAADVVVQALINGRLRTRAYDARSLTPLSGGTR